MQTFIVTNCWIFKCIRRKNSGKTRAKTEYYKNLWHSTSAYTYSARHSWCTQTTGTVIKDHYPNTAHHQCPLSISHLLFPWLTSCLDIPSGMTADVPDLPLPFPTLQKSIPWLPWLLGASWENNKDEMQFSPRLPANWIITFQQLLQTLDLQQGSVELWCVPVPA